MNAMNKRKDKIVLLCDSRLRVPIAAMLARVVPALPVIAYDEVVLGTEVEPFEAIDAEIAINEQELVGVS